MSHPSVSYRVKADILWQCAQLLLVLGLPLIGAFLELCITGSVDFTREFRIHRTTTVPFIVLICISFAVVLVASLWLVSVFKYVARPVFELSAQSITVSGAEFPLDDVVAITARPALDDFVIETEKRTLSFHPHYTSGGLLALYDVFAERFESKDMEEELSGMALIKRRFIPTETGG